MTIRSRLFATVAIPVFTVTSVAPPVAYAAGLDRGLTQSFEVAQETTDEELLLKRQQRREQRQKERAAQEQGGGAEQGGGNDDGGESREQRRQRIEERRKRMAEQGQQQEQQAEPRAQRQNDGGETREQRRQRIEERRKRMAEQGQQQEQQAEPRAQQQNDGGETREQRRQRIEERRKRMAEEGQQQKQQATPDAQPADNGGETRAERQKRIEERRKRIAAEGQQQEDQAAPADANGDGISAEERRRIRAERKAKADAEKAGNADADQPAAGDDNRSAADKADMRQRIEERRKRMADQGNETDDQGKVVLPGRNGAAVLDSDKRSGDDSGSSAQQAERERKRADMRKRIEERRKRVAETGPTSDADSQGEIGDDGNIRRRPPVRVGSAFSEEGRRIDTRPVYRDPDGYRVDRRLDDDREVFSFGGDTWVRGDEDRRIGRDAQETYVERLPRNRVRETIVRSNGVRIITIRNAYGDVIQRSRVDESGREYLLVYSPEADAGRPPAIREIYDDLPPMELDIPVEDYIIDTSSEPDRDYYTFLREPPVEQVERVYSLDEVKYSARIRDKVRRIDLDTITFASGSAEVSATQAKTLRRLADAFLKVLDNDPSETFLIEGHTDATGGDEANLILSDERAESVAEVLTDVYGIPAENLTTQGYGERYLKVKTNGPEQQNRRVTIRRVTALVKPIASAN